jgi:predicted Zn-dependent peptidase
LWAEVRDDLPLIALKVRVPGGSQLDGDQPGLAMMADALLTQGAGTRDALAFSKEMERRAIQIHVSTDRRATTISLELKADQLETALDLLTDMLREPRFDEDAVERVRGQRLAAIAEDQDDPRTRAQQFAQSAWYGEDHPWGHAPGGTDAMVRTLTREALAASWSARAQPQGLHITALGDLDPGALLEGLDARFEGWEGAELPTVDLVAPTPPATTTHHMIHRPNSSQTVLLVLMPGWQIGDEAELAGRMGSVVLGGTFTSRLNRLLREEKGYTYGARARTASFANHGYLYAQTNVQQHSTAPALVDLLSELTKAEAGYTPAETEKARASIRTGLISGYGTRAGSASVYTEWAAHGLGPEEGARQLHALKTVTKAGLDAAAATPSLSHGLIIVLGDLDQIEAKVAEAVPADWRIHRHID